MNKIDLPNYVCTYIHILYLNTVFSDFHDFACPLEMRSRLTFGILKKSNHLEKCIIFQLIKLSAVLFILKQVWPTRKLLLLCPPHAYTFNTVLALFYLI